MPQQYLGSTRRLVIAFDVGTTFSGSSYCFLEPGEVPRIYSVTRFPGQEHTAGSPKVPSILYYDKDGNVRAAGAEVNIAENVEKAEDEEWVKAEWYKLRLRPRSMPARLSLNNLPKLPPGKDVVQIFGDFMAYLMSCTEKFIQETHPNIVSSWPTLRQKAEFVITHPNGWHGTQQAKLRRAAILGNLIPNTAEGKMRVTFVSEGEASLHYCIGEGLVGREEQGFLIADLGGGTLDYSAYKVVSSRPIRVTEIATPKCELEGSSFVTLRAKALLKTKLLGSKYDSDEHIEQIASRFDESTKRTFRNVDEMSLIQFGSVSDRDDKCGIRAGKLKLSGQEVAGLFEPSIQATIDAVKAQIEEAPTPINAVYLVGGFAASPYLISTLKQRLASTGVTVSVPDAQTSKAVADGAISFYLDGHVASRVAPITIGAPSGVPYNAFDPDHLRRISHHRKLPSGRVVVTGGFEVVLEKGTTVTEETEFRRPFFDETTSWETLSNLSLDIIAYTGPGKPPKWIDEVPDRTHFKTLFKVTADTSTLAHLMEYHRARDGTIYWRYDFSLVIKFGAPELRAQLLWYENGIEQRSPAQIIYEDEPDHAEAEEPNELQEEEDEGEDDDELQPDLPARDTFDLAAALQRQASLLVSAPRPQPPSRPLPSITSPSSSSLSRSFSTFSNFSTLSGRSGKSDSEAWKLTEPLPGYPNDEFAI